MQIAVACFIELNTATCMYYLSILAEVSFIMVSATVEKTVDGITVKTEETYGYDAEGVRVFKESDGVKTTYVVDKSETYTQVLAERKSTGEIFYYTRGTRLNSRTEKTTGEKTFYLSDGHGNVRILTDTTGNVTDCYNYNAYGVLLTKEGNTENSYLYCGEQMDNATGLYYLRARYLNSFTGTFTQKDTYEGEMYSPVTQNGYLYTAGNPVMYVDPSGNDYTFAGVEVAMAGRSELDSATSMYYLGILKELTLTLKVAMETYQTGVIATIGAVATLACLEEADVSLFAINDEFHQTIIENIPAPGPVIETLPGYGEAGIGIWVTPIPDQKTLNDYLLWAKKGKGSSKSKSKGGKENTGGSSMPVKDKTTAENGLEYQSNPKHTPGQQGFNPKAGKEPQNSLELFNQSVPSPTNPNQRFAFNKETGAVHRFFTDGNNTWHWCGSTDQGVNSLTGDQIPNLIKTLFGLSKKGW